MTKVGAFVFLEFFSLKKLVSEMVSETVSVVVSSLLANSRSNKTSLL